MNRTNNKRYIFQKVITLSFVGTSDMYDISLDSAKPTPIILYSTVLR